MSNFWDQIKAAFKSAEESNPNEPVIHELIERSEREQLDYDRWKRTLSRRRLLDWLVDQYAAFQTKSRLDDSIAFLDTPSSKGFVIHVHQTQYGKEEIKYFFDYLKERVLELNYRPQISDRRIFNRNQWVEMQERHYLKPRNTFEEGVAIDQRFGNIMVELEYRDDKVYNLRLRATLYSDSLYNKGESFRSLMMAL
jgi:hypothetical protein